MRRTGLLIGAVGLVGAVVVAGCSHSAHESSGGSSAGSSIGSAAIGKVAPAAPTQVGAAADGPASGAGSVSQKLLLGGQSLIRTADLAVTVSNVGTAADSVRRIVTATGGEIDGDDRTSATTGNPGSATLTVRVPPSALQSVLTSLAGLGHEVSRHLSTQDVTSAVADVDSRVRSAAAAIEQLRALYAKATRVSDIIDIETQLTQREADLESLQAQQRAFASQVAMASVTVNLTTTPATAPKHHSTRGFLGGFNRGWHAFLTGAGALVIGIGAALPFLAIVAAAGAVWLLARRRRPRLPVTPSPAAASDAQLGP
jgi:hypothetical protein